MFDSVFSKINLKPTLIKQLRNLVVMRIVGVEMMLVSEEINDYQLASANQLAKDTKRTVFSFIDEDCMPDNSPLLLATRNNTELAKFALDQEQKLHFKPE